MLLDQHADLNREVRRKPPSLLLVVRDRVKAI